MKAIANTQPNGPQRVAREIKKDTIGRDGERFAAGKAVASGTTNGFQPRNVGDPDYPNPQMAKESVCPEYTDNVKYVGNVSPLSLLGVKE